MNTLLNWIGRLAAEYVLIALAMAAAARVGGAAWYVAALLIGTRLHALGVIGHWAHHRLMPGHRWILAATFGPLGIDPRKYARAHGMHHAATSSPVHDHEMHTIHRFLPRWNTYRRRDLVLDALGLHVDEALYVLRTMGTARSLGIYVALVALLFAAIGPAALLWPAGGATGLVLAHRLRAWTEHDHLRRPGLTLTQSRPALWRRALYLPHHTWLHAEHHDAPGRVVWAA